MLKYVYIVFKNEARHSSDSAIDKQVQVSRVFSIFKSFLSLVFPGRVESYFESYVIDTADDIAFGYMNNSVFMLSCVALFYVHSYGCIYSLMLNKLSSGQAKLFCCFGF